MKDDLREFRMSAGLQTADVIDAVRDRYSGFDKTMLSKCENSWKYGVQLLPDAMEAVYALVPGVAEARRRAREDRHKLTCRVHCRVSEDKLGLLQQRMQTDGYATMQDLLSDLLERYLEGGDKDGG